MILQHQSRKSHTKSRLGCSACKQRHQKCDETRPSCVNCLTAHRHCPYLDESRTSTAGDEADASSSFSEGMDWQSNVSPQPIQLVLRGIPKDLMYIELLQKWLTHTYQTCVGPRKTADAFVAIAFNQALNSPFLVRSMLAVAALHKASESEGLEQQQYLAVSDRLQSDGLTRFNSIMSDLNTGNIVPAFLFAFITGIHRLCLAMNRVSHHVEYLSAFIESMIFLRGVSTIIAGWWSYISNSELSILVPTHDSTDASDTALQEEGPVLQLRKLIETVQPTKDLAQTYHHVIDVLQIALRELDKSTATESDTSPGFMVVWVIRLPSEFMQALQEHRPEAFILLAHSAPLLHQKRDHWAIGEAGRALVDAIRSQLSDHWQTWLEWPEQIVRVN